MSSIERGYVHEIDIQSIARDGEPSRDLARLRVNIDRGYRDGENEDGSARYNHDRDFWIDVEMWGARGKALEGVIRQGARVILVGRYENSTWTDRDSGESRSRMAFVASRIAIDPVSVESVAYRPRKESSRGGKDES